MLRLYSSLVVFALALTAIVLVPVALMAHGLVVDTATDTPITLTGILGVLVPIVAAAIAVPLFGWINKGLAVLGNVPDPVKQVIVGLVAALLNKGATALGLTVGVLDPTHLTPDVISQLITGVVAYLFYGHKQNAALLKAANTAVK